MLLIGFPELLAAAYFIMPAYLANAMPIVFGGGRPIDLGKTFLDGQRILGTNKTIKGFLSGFFFGTCISLIPSIFFHAYAPAACLLIPLGSLCGDLGGAFVKRRLNLRPGFPLPLLDQLDFVFGALLFSYSILNFNVMLVFLVLVITPPTHLLTNVFAYLLKMKDNYW